VDGGCDSVEQPNLLQPTALMNALHMQQLQQQQQGQLQARAVLPPQMQLQGDPVANLKLHEHLLLTMLNQHQGRALAAQWMGADQKRAQPPPSQGSQHSAEVSTFAPPAIAAHHKEVLVARATLATLVAGSSPGTPRHGPGVSDGSSPP
jgi:hypothetical protein